jgi:hypothetical protein
MLPCPNTGWGVEEDWMFLDSIEVARDLDPGDEEMSKGTVYRHRLGQSSC